MKISLLQTDIRWESPALNREMASTMIDNAAPADLYVLPEMFTTGFATNPAAAAEADLSTPQWMSAVAKRKGAAIAGSVAVAQQGRFYNRFYFATPDGQVAQYDKKHLFTMGGEHERYTAGTERIIIEYMGLRIMPLVCYDLRFPVWSRAAGEVDLIIYVASWPAPRVAAWDTLLRARAIENQCYVAGVNRVGDDTGNHYNGHSALIDFLGATLAGQPTEEEGSEAVLTGEISREAADAFRTKFPAWADADKFELI